MPSGDCSRALLTKWVGARSLAVMAVTLVAPCREAVPALRAPSQDDIASRLRSGQKTGNLFRLILQIAVHQDRPLTLDQIEAGGDGIVLPKIPAEPDGGDARVEFRHLP